LLRMCFLPFFRTPQNQHVSVAALFHHKFHHRNHWQMD
jgi:hypothetical protein